MRSAGIILLVLSAVFLTGMGGLGGGPEGGVPAVKENVRARVADRQGIATDLQQFSMEGKTFLSAARGSGSVTIPFQEIAMIEFGESSSKGLPIQVHLLQGGSVSLQMELGAVFYGSTGYGAFQIRARAIRRIDFLHDPPR